MQTLTEKDYKKILICLTLYITSLIAANTLGIKIMPFLFGSHITVGIFTFPIVFLMTDLIGEVYGKSLSRWFVRCGLMATILFLFYTIISVALPWSEQGMWAKEGYNLIFGVSGRFGIASVVAFVIAEYQDVYTFFFVREKIGTGLFWLRSLLSNIWSQLLDSIIFMTIAFAGTGFYTTKTLIFLIITQWLFKVAMGLLYTPLCYAGIY
ncbi:MAG TPA: queuosine precursor transporter, partial [Candidatus Paceibacterota bacterium]|nr:queuosine precursor transporter [Candidatus Paceibacterota bacterium]